jgi:transketolase
MTGLIMGENPTPTLQTPELVSAPFAQTLLDLAASHPNVVVLSADLSHYTDLRPFADAYPKRFVQVGMAEQNMMGIAGGLARAGRLPIAVTYGVFATRRAYDQVALALGTGDIHAIIVAFLPGITTPFRATHQATDDLALMLAIPGMTVIDPADATEFSAAVCAAVDHRGPIYIRGLRGQVERRFPEQQFEFEIGRARWVREGHQRLIISTGLATSWALDAAEALSNHGCSASILHVPTLKPIDREAIAAACSRFPRAFVLENHSIVGGLAAAVSTTCAELGINTTVVPLGIPDAWAPAGSLAHIRAQLGLDTDSIAAKILNGSNS